MGNGYDGVIIRDVVDEGEYSAWEDDKPNDTIPYYAEGSDDYVVFSPNQIKSATDNTGAFSRENDDIRYSRKNNAGEKRENMAENSKFASRYETEDGKTINYTSENPETYEVLSRLETPTDSGTGAVLLQRQGDKDGNTPGSGLDTGNGEFCVVERVFRENGYFDFTSGEKIESADDVAFIFSSLEDAAKEHAFIVLVKNGNPTVVELGMGTFNSTLVDIPTVSLAYNRIQPDEVYFVHNHPSGNLKCSPADVQMLGKITDLSDVPVSGVIINLKTGKYGTFDMDSNTGVGEKRTPENAVPLKVHTLDKQIFAPDYDPMSQPMVRSSEDVARFLNSHRMGDRAKVSFLIISQAGRIIGNIHTPFTEISEDTDVKARYISERVIQFGGASAILYGDFDISRNNGNSFRSFRNKLKKVGDTELLDVVHVDGNHTRSANDEGLLYEPGMEYGKENGNEEQRRRIVEEATDEIDLRFRQAEETKKAMESQDLDVMKEQVERLGEKLHTDIIINESAESITHPDKRTEERTRKAKGWYDPKTGKIYINVYNNRDAEDVTATVMHETVAHKGLRELVGEENYDSFLDEVYKHLKGELKQEVDDAAGRSFMNDLSRNAGKGKSYEQHRRRQVDELLGRLAEKPFEEFSEGERTLWQKLSQLVRKLLDKFLGTTRLPDWFTLGENELRYMLWRSKERLERGKEHPMDLARDMVKREELKLGEFAGRDTDNGGNRNAVPESIREANERFNEELDRQIAGTLPKGHIYKIGMPGKVLLSAGFPNMAIELSSTRLAEKAAQDDHPFSLSEVKNLVREINKPLGVFRYGNNAKNVIVGIEHNGKQFLLGVHFNQSHRGTEVSDIRGIFPKDNAEWLNWIKQGKADYLDKEKIQDLIDKQRIILAEVEYLDLDSIANIVENFENPNIEEENDDNDALFRDGDETGDIWSDKSMGLKERTTAAAIRLADNHRDDKTLRNDAMREIGGNLADLRKAMSLQRVFDRTTVKRVADLARVLVKGGYMDGLSGQEVNRLLSAVKNSTGREDITGSVQKVMDIMVDNQLKNAEDTLHALESIKGSKVDARGVEVIGQLDPDGTSIMKVFKKARGWEKKDIEESLDDARDRVGSDDKAVAEEAALEYTGLQLAMEYAESIKDSKTEENKLRDEIKQAREDASDSYRATDAYRQYIASLKEAIRQNKIERVQAYFNLVGRLSGSLRESMANAKAFKETEKQRVSEIQHNANSDMEGRPSDEHYKPKFMDKFVNNPFVSFVFAPLATFDQMLRLMGNKSANGEGYLYNRFTRGWVDARQKEIKGVRGKFAMLDAKAAEIFGGKVKTWGDLIRRVGKLPKGTVSFWNGGEMQERELTQGNLMYIYMVNKMLDGRMKLRKMGITEEDVENIRQVLDPRLMELADWLQEDFLVETRNEYNETHKRLFGASMAAVEHYFPLKILANARADKPEDLDNPDNGDGISTKTGSIIKRRRNALALDITGADALSVILDHVAQMEHWNAFAEFNRDINTLRTYKRFRNQVINMTTIYGSGEKLWEKFNDVCKMAAGTYRPPRAKLDEAATNLAKGVTAAKVSFRMFTALKQFLSMPAFLPEARADHLLADIVNPVGAWRWCMEHLPIFEERWHSRMSGDPRLLKSDMDWKMWRTRVMQLAGKVGMSPNAFVDALTVSIGAHAMYKTRLAQYLRDGYSETDAEKKAVQDAEILYNQTQQSSEGAFTSTMQVDKSWLSILFTVFRNSSMGYTRQLHDAVRNIARNSTPEGREKSIEFMKKQYTRDGINEARAEQNARRKLGRQLWKDALRVATFGYIMQFAWNLGAYLPYLLFGDDDDEKQKMWDDVWARTAFGSVEGLTGGDLISQAGGMWLTGEGNPAYLSKDMPLTSDIMTALQKLGNGQHAEALNDMINLVVQAGLGVNPQSITDVALSIMDACGDDPALAREATICISRILQVPQSQIDKMYFDEIGLSGDEASKYTPAQLAERYAHYKVKRGHFFSPWSWDDEERTGKFKDKADRIIRERAGQTGDPRVDEAYLQYEEVYKGVDARVRAARKMAKTDYAEAARMMAGLQDDPRAFDTYATFKEMDKGLDRLTKIYLGAKSPDEADLCRRTLSAYKAAMVNALDATDEDTRDKAIAGLSSLMQDFSREYRSMQPEQPGHEDERE